MRTQEMTLSLNWKLRRVASKQRQQDVAAAAGISTTRYSAIERGEASPTALETRLIDRFLPSLPTTGLSGNSDDQLNPLRPQTLAGVPPIKKGENS